MGELTGSNDHFTSATNDVNISKFGTGKETESGYPTDVEGLTADDVVKKGMEEYPVFMVSPEEFYSNMKADRKKIRFKTGSKAGEYMKKTRNSHREFYIKTQDSSGTKLVRKIR